MQRIDSPDKRFHDGNPASGDPGTIVSAQWLNTVQEELIAVLDAAGIAVDAGKPNQLASAIRALLAGKADKATTLAGYGITDSFRGEKQIITTSGIFTVPAGVYRVCVTLAGGGGGGAGAINNAPYVPGGGGAGEVKYREWLAVTPGQGIWVSIGAGGAGGTGSGAGGGYANSNGATGGSSSFGTLLSASGGSNGQCQATHSHGGAAGGGPFAADGQDGDTQGTCQMGATGGGNILAPTMHGDYNFGAGGSLATARGYGAGGAGGRAGGYGHNGTAGGSGVCIIEW